MADLAVAVAFSSENLEGCCEIGVVVVVVVVAAAAVVVALKQFWHMLFVAGLPVKPQLLTQGVMVSGTLNSVSSFSVF